MYLDRASFIFSNLAFDPDMQRHCAASRIENFATSGAMPLPAGQLGR